MVFTHSHSFSSPAPQQPSTTNNNKSPFMMSPSAFAAANNTASNNSSYGGAFGAGSAASSASATRPFIGASPTNNNNMMGSGTTTQQNTHDFNSLLANSSSLLSSMGRNAAATHNHAGERGASSSSNIDGGGQQSASEKLGDKSLLELSVAATSSSSSSRVPMNTASNNNNTANIGTATGMRPPSAVSTTTATSYEAEASAHRLLAREGYGFDSARLGRYARELERRTNNITGRSGISDGRMAMDMAMDEEEKKEGGFDGGYYLEQGGPSTHETQQQQQQHSLSKLQGTSIQQILNNHHEYCIKLSIKQARDMTMKQTQQSINDKISYDWERKRNEILGRDNVLGHRFLLGGVSSVNSGLSGGLNKGEGGVVSRVPLLEGDDSGGAAAALSASYSNIIPSPQTLPSNIEGLLKSHLVSIDKYLTSTKSTAAASSNNGMSLLTSLQDTLKEDTTTTSSLSGITPESINGYSNALSLIQAIVNGCTSLGVDLSATSSSPLVVAASVVGSCNFFSQQYTSHIKNVVRESELGGGMVHHSSTLAANLTSTMARDIYAFTSIVAGRDVVEGRGGIWPCLFYCKFDCIDFVGLFVIECFW